MIDEAATGKMVAVFLLNEIKDCQPELVEGDQVINLTNRIIQKARLRQAQTDSMRFVRIDSK